jgi:hypothetical protein
LHHPFFYDKAIIARSEQEYINKILDKHRHEPADEKLMKTLWDELQEEKRLGHISIPFKMALRKDPSGSVPAHIEIILDTKV